MQTSVKETTTPAKQVLQRGVLSVSYTLNCGACGKTSIHMPDPKIKSWEELLRSVTGGLWSWKLTKKFGWVCGCQEIKRRNANKKVTAQTKTLSQQDDDLPF